MVKKISTSLFSVILLGMVSACNMPQGDLPAVQQTAVILTAVAETVAAGGINGAGPPETGQASDTPRPPEITPTETLLPSVTPIPTDTSEPSDTPIPCNRARFIMDVTIPDGTVFEPGESFTKTWKIKNTGSCTWTSGYDIVFWGGDAMGAPGSVQITTSTVYPGNNVDISVELTAPVDQGTYLGNWQLRDPSDVIFGIENSSSGLFWVEIKVKKPTPTEETVLIDLTSGTWWNLG